MEEGHECAEAVRDVYFVRGVGKGGILSMGRSEVIRSRRIEGENAIR